MSDYQLVITMAVEILHLAHGVLGDLREGREEEAVEKLRAGLTGRMDPLPVRLAEQTSNLLASAYGALVSPEPDSRHAEQPLRELVDLYARYVH